MVKLARTTQIDILVIKFRYQALSQSAGCLLDRLTSGSQLNILKETAYLQRCKAVNERVEMAHFRTR